MSQNRKSFLKRLSAGLLLAGLPGISVANNRENKFINEDDFNEGAADDEQFWKRIARKYYSVSKDYINLENGYYGIQSLPVLEAFRENIEFANKDASRFARKTYPGLLENIKKELADFLHVLPEEIILVRNATEALNIAIQGYPFRPGDEVIINTLDYFSMIETFRMLEKRGRISVKAIELPLSDATEDAIVESYSRAINERTRVILLTHVSNINGLILPVARIAKMAREKGIDSITDSAHALGQIKFDLKELESDFVGMNLHKWIGNPIGAGVLYVKQERVAEMSPFFGDINSRTDSIGKLAHLGTTSFAVNMTIPDSLKFHNLLGVERISRRLHYLKNTWIEGVKDLPGVEIVTPPSLSCAIASFRISGRKSSEVIDHLYNKHKVLTVGRALGENGCVRVTPAIFNNAGDTNRLVDAVKDFVKG